MIDNTFDCLSVKVSASHSAFAPRGALLYYHLRWILPLINFIFDVVYTYGTTGNGTGRVVGIEDGSGIQEISYDEMGNISRNVRTLQCRLTTANMFSP